MRLSLMIVLFVMMLTGPVAGAVMPNSLFTDHAVLQREMPIPVWGSAEEGERVTVEFAGQSVTVEAKGGQWQAWLKPLPAGGPYVLIIKGSSTAVVLKDVWLGDVWICSGQSNMERHLGLQSGQKPIVDWEKEAVVADYPKIRQYRVPKRPSDRPLGEAEGDWVVCSSETVSGFSAVGYFFAQDLYKIQDIPIGLIFTAWGGTIAEAWTSAESLKTMPDFAAAVKEVDARAQGPDRPGNYGERLAQWYQEHDRGSAEHIPWAQDGFNDRDWPVMTLPVKWEADALPNFDGIVWFRKTVDLPAHWAGQEAVLSLGPIDDQDTTWINGIKVGQQDNWQSGRTYQVPVGVLKAGQNVIAIRVLDTAGSGGIYGKPKHMSLMVPGLGANAKIALAGTWSYQPSVALRDAPNLPRKPGNSPNVATVLYNGMIAPLLPARIKGAIWYQGESNNSRARQYRELFPLMIQDWRKQWKQGDFPFLFVQIAPFKEMSPEIREAQFLTLGKSPHTAMVVTTDVGDAQDIHPANKKPVGMRLALAARALAYGEDIVFSGPLYEGMAVREDSVVVSFTHVGGGLVAKDGDLKGFVIAGEDKQFVQAAARIEGNTVVVSNDAVKRPVAVRYGWSNVPDVNLYNQEGLPASPFRTDVD